MKLGAATVKNRPEAGDYRITIRFAWLPRVVEQQWIWLEKFKQVYEYRFRERAVSVGSKVFYLPAEDWDLIAEQMLNPERNSRNKQQL